MEIYISVDLEALIGLVLATAYLCKVVKSMFVKA